MRGGSQNEAMEAGFEPDKTLVVHLAGNKISRPGTS
jgi:hypothetical protein